MLGGPFAVSGVLLGACLLVAQLAGAQSITCQGGTITFIAHADDDLLFQAPYIGSVIDSGACFTSVIVTSGDAGIGLSYASQRELGNEAAKAYMAGVSNSWSELPDVTRPLDRYLACLLVSGRRFSFFQPSPL